MAQPFERDLGYLDRFLEKVKAHAADLADRVQGERLASLIDGEVTRWQEIRGLLAVEADGSQRIEDSGDGAPATEEAPPAESGPSPEPAPEGLAPEPSRRGRAREAHQGRRWTVGPLRPH